MPTFSYKGYEFEVDHMPTEEEFSQMSAYVDSLPPKEEKKSLVDQIPGIAPEVKSQEKEFSLGEKALGLGEAALSQATGLTTGGLGFAGGAIKGILGDIAQVS